MSSPRPRVFYGWVLVAVTFVTGAVGNAVSFWAVGALAVPITADLGWSRTSYLGAMTVRSILSGVIAPFVGPLQDTRSGPRLLMVVSAVSLGAGIMSLAFMQELWQFYLMYGVLGALSVVGTSDMLSNAIIPKWFVRRRGIALSNATAGTALGSLLAPVALAFILGFTTWRNAWLILGAFTLVVVGGLGLLVRSRPEDMGLHPDGAATPPAAPAAAAGSTTAYAEEPSFTRSEALRQPAFWYIVVAWALGSIGLGGFHIHWLPYFADIGFTASQGALITTVYGFASLSGRFLWGPLSERFAVRLLLGAQSFTTAASVLGFLLAGNNLVLLLAAATAHGLALGGFFILRPLNVANYFGRRNLGAVGGVMRPWVTLANAFGPIMVAGFYDVFHSYTWSFWFVTACWVLAGVTSMLAKPPVRTAAPAPAAA